MKCGSNSCWWKRRECLGGNRIKRAESRHGIGGSISRCDRSSPEVVPNTTCSGHFLRRKPSKVRRKKSPEGGRLPGIFHPSANAFVGVPPLGGLGLAFEDRLKPELQQRHWRAGSVSDRRRIARKDHLAPGESVPRFGESHRGLLPSPPVWLTFGDPFHRGLNTSTGIRACEPFHLRSNTPTARTRSDAPPRQDAERTA